MRDKMGEEKGVSMDIKKIRKINLRNAIRKDETKDEKLEIILDDKVRFTKHKFKCEDKDGNKE